MTGVTFDNVKYGQASRLRQCDVAADRTAEGAAAAEVTCSRRDRWPHSPSIRRCLRRGQRSPSPREPRRMRATPGSLAMAPRHMAEACSIALLMPTEPSLTARKALDAFAFCSTPRGQTARRTGLRRVSSQSRTGTTPRSCRPDDSGTCVAHLSGYVDRAA